MTKKSRPALTNFRRNVREMTDFDYVHKLSEEEADWLEKFANEYYSANFSKISNFHVTDEQRRKCYNANNARQRDLWNRFMREMGDCANRAAENADDEDKNG